MLGSITPLGERGRNSRWWVTMTAFVLGSAIGGAALGGGLGWLGSLERSAIGGTFGLARAATSFSVARVRRPDQLARVDSRLRRMDRPSRRIAVAVEVGLGGAALAAGLFAW